MITPNRKKSNFAADASQSQYQHLRSGNPNRMDSAWATPQTMKNSKLNINYCFTPFVEENVPDKLTGCHNDSNWSSKVTMPCDQSTMGNTTTYASTMATATHSLKQP